MRDKKYKLNKFKREQKSKSTRDELFKFYLN